MSCFRHHVLKIFSDVNKLVRDGVVEVNGQHIRVEMFLGGDYKV